MQENITELLAQIEDQRRKYMDSLIKDYNIRVIPYGGKYAGVFDDNNGITRLLVVADGPYKSVIFSRRSTCEKAIATARRFSFSGKNCKIV